MSQVSQYEAVIGLEIHVQLATASKMFCRCDNQSEGVSPNAHTCPVCFGMPGTLPVPNRQAVEWALKTALALGCKVPEVSKFDRKQYFYPDLPKGYQISQYDEPLGGPGKFEFDTVNKGKAEAKTVRITRLHLEEDAGKLTHPPGADYSLVDLNRAGTPLMEIVTEPDLRIPAEAKTFLQELRTLMRYLGVSDADMEKGHLRADANVSIRKVGDKKLGTKTELKNLNSFRFVEKGLRSEIDRQMKLLESGETVTQETRGFDEDKGKTVSQRSKEEAQDYRYFPEPDIPPLEPHKLGLDRLKKDIPELPVQRKRRWIKQYPSLPPDLPLVVMQSTEESELLDKTLTKHRAAGGTVGRLWLMFRSDPYYQKNLIKLSAFCSGVAPLVKEGKLSGPQTKQLAEEFAQSNRSIKEIISRSGALQRIDESELANLIDNAIKANPKPVADFKAGNLNAKQAIVGWVMKETKGSADPAAVNKLLEKKLQ